jgi:hypothetical protein
MTRSRASAKQAGTHTAPSFSCRRCDKPIWSLVGLRPHQRYCSTECKVAGPEAKR